MSKTGITDSHIFYADNGGTFEAQIERFDDDATQCWVIGHLRGLRFCSSLSLAQSLGGIESDADDGVLDVPTMILESIDAWASSTGNY